MSSLFIPCHVRHLHHGFKSDDSLLSGGSVEGHHRGLFWCTDCLLHAIECSLWGMDLATYVSGKYTRGLMVTGATVCIRLL